MQIFGGRVCAEIGKLFDNILAFKSFLSKPRKLRVVLAGRYEDRSGHFAEIYKT